MVLNKSELIAILQNEVRILLHLAGKIDPAKLDYRPTPKQRSTLELLRYLSMMGPTLLQVARAGTFDADAWTQAEQAAQKRDLAECVAAIADHAKVYEAELGAVSDADLRAEIELWGERGTRGSFLVGHLVGGCAAYRMQLFLYLKGSGRSELSSMNLWGGADAPAA